MMIRDDAGRLMHAGNELERCFVCKEAERIIHLFMENRDYHELVRSFDSLRSVDPDGTKHLLRWQVDAALVAQEWDAAWEYRHMGLLQSSRRITLEDLVEVRKRCSSAHLSAEDLHLIVLSDNGLTSWGMERLEEVNAAADAYLHDFYDSEGTNPALALHRDYGDREPSDQDLADIADQCDHIVTAEAMCQRRDSERYTLQKYSERHGTAPAGSAHDRWIWEFYIEPKKWCFQPTQGRFVGSRRDMGGTVEELPRLSYTRQPSWMSLAMEGLCRAVLRRAENDVRQALGVPSIGEGWVSETELFRLIEQAFPEARVVRHARPRWLKPQHLDVYMPDYGVALEYQGAQHDEPVDFFGGEEAFVELRRRDARKRELCRKNDCILIEVRPGYDPTDLIRQVREARGDVSLSRD